VKPEGSDESYEIGTLDDLAGKRKYGGTGGVPL